MKDEFNLSDLSEKAHFTSYDDKDRNVYFEEDVKEFIKLIKEMLKDIITIQRGKVRCKKCKVIGETKLK